MGLPTTHCLSPSYLMQLSFRTRGGPIHGWGNVYRLAAFASYCQSRLQTQIRFVVEGPPEVHRFCPNEGLKSSSSRKM